MNLKSFEEIVQTFPLPPKIRKEIEILKLVQTHWDKIFSPSWGINVQPEIISDGCLFIRVSNPYEASLVYSLSGKILKNLKLFLSKGGYRCKIFRIKPFIKYDFCDNMKGNITEKLKQGHKLLKVEERTFWEEIKPVLDQLKEEELKILFQNLLKAYLRAIKNESSGDAL